MVASKIILDNADIGTESYAHFNSKVVCVYVRSGSAEILHDGQVIVSLTDVTWRKICDGLPIGTTVMARALESGTTLVFTDG